MLMNKNKVGLVIPLNIEKNTHTEYQIMVGNARNRDKTAASISKLV